MKTPKDLFPKHCFWDCRIEELDLKGDYIFIIPRLLYYVNKENFETNVQFVESIYTPSEVVEAFRISREMVDYTMCAWIAKRYNVPPFRIPYLPK